MKLIYVLTLSLTLLSLLSCGQKIEYVVQKQTEHPHIPRQLESPVKVPVKAADPLTISEALRQGRDMRKEFCVLYAQYRELLRNSSFGEIVIDRATEDRCPSDLND